MDTLLGIITLGTYTVFTTIKEVDNKTKLIVETKKSIHNTVLVMDYLLIDINHFVSFVL